MERERIPIEKILLKSIAVVGVLGIAILAPNALQVIKQFSGRKNYNKKFYLKNAIGNLLKKNYISFEVTNGKKFVKLTEKGKIELLKYQMGDLKIKRPRKWDKKWRMVIFDIKEKRRGTRAILRSTLIRLGFVKLQNSVWVFPYDCEELVIMLKSELFVGKDVLYLVVEKIENDKWIRENFGI